MDKYIKANALKQRLLDLSFYPVIVKHAIDDIPPADVAPVRHGHWIDKTEDTRREYVCSECGRSVFLHFSHAIKEEPALLKVMYPYCHCGAKMDKEE